MSGNIGKLYLSSFLAGFIIWYGIDKLYLTSLGFSATTIGLAVLVLQLSAVLIDIPAGVISDRWSRKHMLTISMAALVAAALLMGGSTRIATWLGLGNPLGFFLAGIVCYALHVATFYSTSDALVYDTLMETDDKDCDGKPVHYIRFGARAYAVNLVGYAVACLVSGLVVQILGSYEWTFIVAAGPAILGLLVVLTLCEPSFREARQKRKLLLVIRTTASEIRQGSQVVLASGMIKPLLGIMGLLWTVEAFKEGFGQIYFLKTAPQQLGGLTAPTLATIAFGIFYGIWALGETRADKYHGKFQQLVLLSTLPLVVVGTALTVSRNLPAILVAFVAYLVQAYYSAILFRQISGEIHNAVPSSEVRDSVMSVRSFFGRLVSCAALLIIGLLIDHFDIVWSVWLVTVFAVLALIVWLNHAHRLSAHPKTITAPESI